MNRVLIGVALAAALLVLPACAAKSVPGGDAYSGYGTPGAVKPGSATPLAPGRFPKRGGRLEVIGTLQREEGNSWIVVGAEPAQAASGHVIAVIVNSATLHGVTLTDLEDSYVRVTGTAAEGIATDKAGLDIIADTVTKLPSK